MTISAELRMKGVRIFYTNDGSEPTRESLVYEQPFPVKESGVYKFKAYHFDWKPSAVSSVKLYEKGSIPDKLDWKTNASTSYPDEDLMSLVNHKKGTRNFRDIEWVGFDTIAKTNVSFEKKTYINSLTIGYLIDTKSWIFPPKEVIIYLNKKDTLRITTKGLSKGDLVKIDDVRIPIQKEVTSMTILINNSKLPEWHPGKGNNAWLFMDEWIFNE